MKGAQTINNLMSNLTKFTLGIHGFDLGIDSPIAPRELIEINPLPEYKIPYDFMKRFNFDKSHQVWVNDVKQRMEETQQKKDETKKGFWASLFKR
ncbi:hypothetical protein [Rodentibacter trehalosifermentans]|uniref:Uncharacterized protein n=1 Tax=Rodentibacter trehalosifermentans TaxID=1908263 RepID=A0A1V3IR18_9PAST|nr:hypothetical protein [Rodentibacter trehalosifermentans]OOF44698.1 hypothetical protein BKK51_08475 [Rodentibacter trehalosifermentans]OOF45723.1 hypothetical protein BKK52_12130 [Rodentibacter trehalosifermentans]OOF47824.1 hypothetical protein BKK53_10745 [Rodentibacter trehalosifermentans]